MRARDVGEHELRPRPDPRRGRGERFEAATDPVTLLSADRVRRDPLQEMTHERALEDRDLELVELPRVDEPVGLPERHLLEARGHAVRLVAPVAQGSRHPAVVDELAHDRAGWLVLGLVEQVLHRVEVLEVRPVEHRSQRLGGLRVVRATLRRRPEPGRLERLLDRRLLAVEHRPQHVAPRVAVEHDHVDVRVRRGGRRGGPRRPQGRLVGQGADRAAKGPQLDRLDGHGDGQDDDDPPGDAVDPGPADGPSLRLVTRSARGAGARSRR